MAETYRYTLPRRAVNALMRLLLRLGLAPRGTHLLTAPGRRSGRPFSTPIQVITREGERWLVSPYGERAWVKNARAAGQVTLSRGSRRETVSIEEVSAEQAAPVLKQYVAAAPITRKFFDVRPDSPIEDFVKEAPRHPVFRVGQSVG